ncbi:sulfate transporter [Niveomyces insectorum RCEF 264]|uniref:Sulfate transporter n=1 Tax=Niveomyces insectorum RCEF 264 TaxID=1081102 RepID=A0A167XMU1_9HYPO|nr:sulfate transporter [Niveomyces insectorum RCEF 264]
MDAKGVASGDAGTATYTPDRNITGPPDLRILHYNDVYHLDPSSAEPVGGAARFQTLVHEYQSAERFEGQPGLVTLFSGDAFNPSLESSITKGSHMVPVLNGFGTACACVGNHDLDFGVTQFEYLTAKCRFPWLLANVFDPALGADEPIGHARRTCMITSSNGVKIGLLGLGEREWLETVNALPPNLIYKSATETAKQLIPQLRKDGADMIVILSHAREPNDNKLAANLDGAADLILGGHDHYYAHSFINGTHVLRSGSDFKQLSYIEAWRRQPETGAPPKWDFAIWRRDVVSSIAPDQPTLDLVEHLTAKLKLSLEKAVGWTAAPLDARFTTVRTKESNLANFVCDIMRHHYQADCAIMAGGTIRGDQVYPPGPVRVKDITDCFPFEDPVVVIRVTGKAILAALENGVSLYPALEGRFPQVSNIIYEFDPSRPPGSRITHCEIGGGPPELDKQYVLCTRGYMARGKDGYTSLLVQSAGGSAEELVDEESGILISMMLRQYFMALKVLDQWKHWTAPLDHHWGRIVTNIDRHHPHLRPSAASPSPSLSRHSGGFDFPVVSGSDRGRDLDRDLDRGPDHDPDHEQQLMRRDSWDDWSAARLRQRRSSVTPFNERVVDGASPAQNTDELQHIDWQMRIMRRVARKWCRLAGVHSRLADSLTEAEYEADWTRAIAPRVEGRIRVVGENGGR